MQMCYFRALGWGVLFPPAIMDSVVVFTLPQGDEALWSLSCTCRLALRKARAPGGSSTPFHVFLNPTPSTEDVI